MVTHREPRSSRPHTQVMKNKYSRPHVNMCTTSSHTVVTTGCLHRSTPSPTVTPTLESTWQSREQHSHTPSSVTIPHPVTAACTKHPLGSPDNGTHKASYVSPNN